jgi:hypothetical protein
MGMNLDDQITDFLATADGLPAQSKLEPYMELIRGLRQKRWTYRKIAAALKDRFGLSAAPSTIHDFVRVRAKQPHAGPLPQPRTPELPQPGPVPRKPRFHLDA